MAKTNSAPTATGASDDRKPKMRLDISKVSMVGDVGLNDEVTVTVTGRVTSIRGPELSLSPDYLGKGGEKEHLYPGCLEVEVGTVKVQADGIFSGMDADEDGE